MRKKLAVQENPQPELWLGHQVAESSFAELKTPPGLGCAGQRCPSRQHHHKDANADIVPQSRGYAGV